MVDLFGLICQHLSSNVKSEKWHVITQARAIRKKGDLVGVPPA